MRINIIRAILKATTLGLSKGAHLTRYYMYRHLSRFRVKNTDGFKVLSIGKSKPLCELFGFTDNQIIDTNYPEVSILNIPYPDNSFDYVFSDQVLEHVEGFPQEAIDESFRVLKPGGICVHTTCLLMPIHQSTGDYWRFTPQGLALLVKRHARIIDADGWGNRYVWIFTKLGIQFDPVPHSRWHPIHWLATKNSTRWFIHTWIIAEKK
jgi:SAM-dependent methyltransferase